MFLINLLLFGQLYSPSFFLVCAGHSPSKSFPSKKTHKEKNYLASSRTPSLCLKPIQIHLSWNGSIFYALSCCVVLLLLLLLLLPLIMMMMMVMMMTVVVLH